MEKMLSWKKPSSGVTLSQEAAFGRYHKEPLLGVTLDFEHQQRKDPPIRRRSVSRLKSCGRIFTPGGLPAISANQRTLLLFNPLMTSDKIVKLLKYMLPEP